MTAGVGLTGREQLSELDVVELTDEVAMKGSATKLAVGNRAEAERFLKTDQGLNGTIFELAQFVCGGLMTVDALAQRQ
jgi:hypothetical protein